MFTGCPSGRPLKENPGYAYDTAGRTSKMRQIQLQLSPHYIVGPQSAPQNLSLMGSPIATAE